MSKSEAKIDKNNENYKHGQNIWEKLWFLCEIKHYRKSKISILE